MTNAIENYDSMYFRMYTGKSERDKAIATLKGILSGITLDGKVDNSEIEELTNWITINEHLEDTQPFRDIFFILRLLLEDGIIDDEEIEDLRWICKQFSEEGEFYDLVTLAIQELHGIFHGLLADNHLSDQEILSLKSWLGDNFLLKGTYPYDEICALISNALVDGKIDDFERNQITAFMGDFIDCSASFNINKPQLEDLKSKYNIQGICAIDPHIEIDSKTFCFTGKSSRASRSEIERTIIDNHGIFNNNVVKTTEYLLVGDEGNPCWAFSCYGRKVEKAVELRKNGVNILIVHENDFWKTLSK